MNCYYCHEVLTKENKSEEHIIPNSLGGRMCSYRLLCKGCNEKLGGTIDVELYKQLGFIADAISAKRDRKKSDRRIKMIGDNGQVAYVDPQEGLARRSTLTFPLKNSDKDISIPLNDNSPAKTVKKKSKELERVYGKLLET